MSANSKRVFQPPVISIIMFTTTLLRNEQGLLTKHCNPRPFNCISLPTLLSIVDLQDKETISRDGHARQYFARTVSHLTGNRMTMR